MKQKATASFTDSELCADLWRPGLSVLSAHDCNEGLTSFSKFSAALGRWYACHQFWHQVCAILHNVHTCILPSAYLTRIRWLHLELFGTIQGQI